MVLIAFHDKREMRFGKVEFSTLRSEKGEEEKKTKVSDERTILGYVIPEFTDEYGEARNVLFLHVCLSSKTEVGNRVRLEFANDVNTLRNTTLCIILYVRTRH